MTIYKVQNEKYLNILREMHKNDQDLFKLEIPYNLNLKSLFYLPILGKLVDY
jgi:hypothetical protein